MTMPWYAWAYVALLALIAAGGLVTTLRAQRPLPLGLLRFAAMVVFAYGVLAWHRGSGANTLFAGLLFAATLVQAQKAVADANELRVRRLPAPVRAGTALGGLAVLPAIALGALAVWSQMGG